MVCKHQSEWSYSWERIKEDAKAFFKYHYPNYSSSQIQQSLNRTEKVFNATYTFWKELKAKGIFHTDTFWYFEPFAWVIQMMKIFKWDFKTEEDGWPVKLSYICVFFLKRSSISFGFFFHS